MGAGISVRHRMVMISQIVSAMGCNGLQLVVDQERIHPPGQAAGAIKLIFGIGQVVGKMGGFQATLIERAVMGHQRNILQLGGDTGPDFFKIGRIERVLHRNTMHGCRPPGIKIRSGTDKAIDRVYNLVVLYNSNTHMENAALVLLELLITI